MASSSCSKSSSKAPRIGNVVMTKPLGEVLFISAASNENTPPGTLKLPNSFVAKYSRSLPESIELRLGNGKLWFGRFVHATESIEGLHYLMQYYNVKPHHFFVFHYNGGSEFGVQIFNEYAVEIEYSPTLRVVTSSDYEANHLALSKKGLFEMTDIEKDKLRCTFMYNAHNTFHRDYDILITNDLLEKKDNYAVFTKEDCADLKLNASMNWIQLSFRKHSWKISLIWEDDEVLFGPDWHKFSTEAMLAAGDLCMLSVTNDDQHIDVAVFQFNEQNVEYHKCCGEEAKKCAIWFKVMNGESIATGQVAIPLLFLEKYGDFLCDNLTLIVGDGNKFEAYFSKALDLMYGLKPLIQKYGVKDKYLIFFEYVGNHTFYVSIYNLDGIELMSNVGEKLMDTTIEAKCTPEVITLSDCSDDENERNKAVASSVHETLQSFNVVLLKSHVDQNGHGVFLPRHLLPVYRKWKKGTAIKLCVGRRSWTISLLRNKKVCRLGLGWNGFTEQNKLKVGDKLSFCYVGNHKFSVEVTCV